MSINRQKKSTSICLNSIHSWKIRSIHGFEKYLFSNIHRSIKSTPKNIDPARFIYPRDAMGNLLISLSNRNISQTLYLPKYDFIKIRSPAWTISVDRCRYK